LAALQTIERDYDHGMADIHRHYRRQLDALFAADINQLLPVQPVSPHTTEPPPHEVTWRRWQDARQHGHTAPLSIHVSREDIQTPPPGGWVPRKPAYPLAQARDV